MKTAKSPSQTVFNWLVCNLGKGCLAPLTGTDARALRAAVEIVECYAYNRTPELLDAFRLVVLYSSQEVSPVRRLFFHSIAHVLDWQDRAAIWRECQLPSIPHLGTCAFEPNGCQLDLSKETRERGSELAFAKPAAFVA